MSCTHKIYSEVVISNLIPHSLNLQCKLNGIRSLRNKMFWLVVLDAITLTILTQVFLNFNTFIHFKVVKCLQMTKTKHLRDVKQNWKRLFSVSVFCDFFERGNHYIKSECVRMKSRTSLKLENWMTNTFEPRHDKVNKLTVRPAKSRSTWASAQSDQSSLCAQWVAKRPRFLYADSEDSSLGAQSLCWFCHVAAHLSNHGVMVY